MTKNHQIITLALVAGLGFSNISTPPSDASFAVTVEQIVVEGVPGKIIEETIVGSQPGHYVIDSEFGLASATIGATPRAGIVIDTGFEVRIGLASDANYQNIAKIGTTESSVARVGTDADAIPVVNSDGSAQIITILDSDQAPRQFVYPIGLPEGFHLVADKGGARVVDRLGDTVGHFEKPWAFDASGRVVPTEYQVIGNTLIQVIHHTEMSFDYPIIADPTYVTTAYYYSRSQVEEMYRGAKNINNVCNFTPLSALAAIGCKAPVALEDALTQAHYQQRRVKALYYNCGFNYCSYYVYYVVI